MRDARRNLLNWPRFGILQMQPCDCQSRPAFFEIHLESLTEFLSGLERRTSDGLAIYPIFRCPVCSTIWLVDDMTRGPIAVRLNSEEAAIGFDERPYRRQLAVNMHGGISDQKCMFVGCENRALRGILFCVDHQYPEYAGRQFD